MDPLEVQLKQVELLVKETTPLAVESMRATISYGMAAIRGMFLLNGAAALAAMTKADPANPLYSAILIAGGVGAFCAVLSAAFSYLSQTFFSLHLTDTTRSSVDAIFSATDAPEQKSCNLCKGRLFQGLAITAFVVSVIAFSLGMIDVIKILNHLN